MLVLLAAAASECHCPARAASAESSLHGDWQVGAGQGEGRLVIRSTLKPASEAMQP